MTIRKKSFALLCLVTAVFTASVLFSSLVVPNILPQAQTAGQIRDITGEVQYDASADFSARTVQALPETVDPNSEISLIADFNSGSAMDEATQIEDGGIARYLTSARGVAQKKQNDERQKALKKALKRARIPFSVEERYEVLFSGVSLTIQASDYEKASAVIEKLGYTAVVSETYLAPKAQVVTNDVNVYETGIFDSSEAGYDGSGTIVAVLDSGFDYTHSAYQQQPEKLAKTFADIQSVLPQTAAGKTTAGLSAADVYVSSKIPFAYDYADSDTDVYPLESAHGTHVGAIIAGKDDVITGVAPGAQLALMKVFSDVNQGAKSNVLVAALEDCVALGVDVINMSLGSACGFTREVDKQFINDVYDKIRAAGISLIVAASNDYNSTFGSEKNGNLGLTSNPDSATVGSPSTYEAAMSVASISGVLTPYLMYGNEPVYYLEASNAAGEPYDFMDMLLGASQGGSFPYVTIPGFGRPSNYLGLDMHGKIALVSRGQITFEEKSQYAYEAGAKAIIIYNNVSGDIRMSAGNGLRLPTISISQDDGERLAAQASGTIEVYKTSQAGPFMSDFSSWGPTPDLRIKPEITAHGGEILSAIPGGKYDRMSGTSMAAPNQAGVTTIVRQYVKEKFPALDSVGVTALVNQLTMSTTDIAYNQSGTPYAVRKQGAGLANLTNIVTTDAYITVKNADGKVKDKTKIELGDDPQKTGVYTLDFTVNNISDKQLRYTADALVLTEGVSKALTDDDKTTVTELSEVISDCRKEVSVNGAAVQDGVVIVPAGGKTEVSIRVTLSNATKARLDANFANGMYIEGFVRLMSGDGGVHLDAPFLAFYGDWTRAPLFDLSYFETDPDAMNDAIDLEDKTRPDAYATTPIGGLSDDYVNYLGSYYFIQNPNDVQIAADEDHCALTNDPSGVNSIYAVWAGMLRGAKTMQISIADAVTGREVYRDEKHNQAKSYSYGGTLISSNVEMKFSPSAYGLPNNGRYTVSLKGLLDYRDGGADTNLKNEYSFTFTTDYEAPSVTGAEFYTEYDKTTKKTRVFAKLSIFDNHYAMALRLGSLYVDKGAAVVESFGKYMTPIYSERNSTSTVTVELTDYMDQIRNSYEKNTFVVMAYDYAMNESVYEIPVPDEIYGIAFEEDEVTLSVNQTYTLTPKVYPDTEWHKTLEYTVENPAIARVVDGNIVALKKGTTRITARDGAKKGTSATMQLTVLGEGDPGFVRYDPPVAAQFRLTSFTAVHAFYATSSDQREIGLTGYTTEFGRSASLSMFPGEKVQVHYSLKAYFPATTKVVFSAGNKNVTVTPDGEITAMNKGISSVTAKVTVDGKDTLLSERISITVKDPVTTTGPNLASYRGSGTNGDYIVVLPDDLGMTTIGQYAFSLYEYVPKESWEITEEDPYYTKPAPLGNDTIKEVVIPYGVETIEAFAFAKLTALEKVTLPSTMRQINNGAFQGCEKLKTVAGLGNVQIISENAFAGCTALEAVDLREAIALGAGSFADSGLKSVALPKLESAGEGAFANCRGLRRVTFGKKMKLDASIFQNCMSLSAMEVNAPVIPENAFLGCAALTSITLGKDVQLIGKNAFAGTKVSVFNLDSANPYLRLSSDKTAILSADGTALAALTPLATTFTNSEITRIDAGAFAGNGMLTAVSLPNVRRIEANAFNGCTKLSSFSAPNLEYVGDYAFYNTVLTALPDLGKLTNIGAYAFSGTPVQTLAVPEGAVVGEYAFAECHNLVEITAIGDRAELKKGAFYGDTALTAVTDMGDLVKIGDYAFYNCEKLATADLSGVTEIGTYAFSGDVETDKSGNITASHATRLTAADLSALTEIAKGAFLYCPELQNVTVGDMVTTIGIESFGGCAKLTTVTMPAGKGEAIVIGSFAFIETPLASFDFGRVNVVGAFAFAGTALTAADLSSVTGIPSAGIFAINAGAFSNCRSLASVTLAAGSTIDDEAFDTCTSLTAVAGLSSARYIGDYAFFGTAFATADLSATVYLGDYAFGESALTSVVLGESLNEMGANPFYDCALGAFTKTVVNEFGIAETVYDFAVGDTLRVAGGALYQVLPNGGLELVCYPKTASARTYSVQQNTYRIGDRAFYGSASLRVVFLPYELRSIGDAAFFGCQKLSAVHFGSIEAPILESRYNAEYVQTDLTVEDENSPYVLGIVPFEMWTRNYFFNRNFVDYLGKTGDLTVTYPKNGTGYNNFIYETFFTDKIVTATVANDATRAVIGAIEELPDIVALSDEDAILRARSMYDALGDKEQVALVTNYNRLVSSEDQLKMLKTTDEPQPVPPVAEKDPSALVITLIVLTSVFGAGLAVFLVLWLLLLRKTHFKTI